jgi:hypothetical protein
VEPLFYPDPEHSRFLWSGLSLICRSFKDKEENVLITLSAGRFHIAFNILAQLALGIPLEMVHGKLT